MTLIGKKARNHPQQVRRDGVDDSIDDRRTPGSVFNPLNETHRFTIDAAASADNAKCPRFFDRKRDGLAQSWAGERVWCNPPYSSIEPWVVKAWNEMRRGCELVVMLLPANRTEQGWWQTYVEPRRDGLGGGAVVGAPNGSLSPHAHPIRASRLESATKGR